MSGARELVSPGTRGRFRTLMLHTLADPRAPWRQTAAATPETGDGGSG